MTDAERERAAVPIRSVIRRMEDHRDHLTSCLREIPWWQRRKRLLLIGARTVYQIEIEAAERLLKEDRS